MGFCPNQPPPMMMMMMMTPSSPPVEKSKSADPRDLVVRQNQVGRRGRDARRDFLVTITWWWCWLWFDGENGSRDILFLVLFLLLFLHIYLQGMLIETSSSMFWICWWCLGRKKRDFFLFFSSCGKRCYLWLLSNCWWFQTVDCFRGEMDKGFPWGGNWDL